MPPAVDGAHVLVTGGAGFIGRHVVAELLARGARVTAFDNLATGRAENLADVVAHVSFAGLVVGDVRDAAALGRVFAAAAPPLTHCVHLAASIQVQRSLDEPRHAFDHDVAATFEVLEACRRHHVALALMSTCMVYAPAAGDRAIDETWPASPASPYAAAKLAAEHLVLSYHRAYGHPVTVLRPFNTYGPCQRSDGEGGVVSVFLARAARGEPLLVYGDGRQTRDLLYVEDCARFVCDATFAAAANGRVLNAGTGVDVTIDDLAARICPDPARRRHVPHIHPRSEVPRLRCDARLAHTVLGWAPRVDLDEGLRRTRRWLTSRREHAPPPGVRAGATA
jgi:nucleoside-diphosphate-sugar epimerase